MTKIIMCIRENEIIIIESKFCYVNLSRDFHLKNISGISICNSFAWGVVNNVKVTPVAAVALNVVCVMTCVTNQDHFNE